MARNEVTLRFKGDDSDLVSSLNKVGTEAKEMADDIDRAARDSSRSIDTLEGDANAGLGRLNEGVEGSVGKFRGFKDTVDGTTDIAQGFATGDVSMMLGGFADLADGISSVILPKLNELVDTMGTKIKGAATSANTALASLGSGSTLGALGVFAGTLTAILVTLEAIDVLIEKILNAPEDLITGPFETIKDFLDDPGGLGLPDVGKGALDQLRDLLPFHTGGMVHGHGGQNVAAILQAGETVIPRGQNAGGNTIINVGGSIITERDFGRLVADALRQNKLMGVT